MGNLNRARGMLVGLAVGDVLGVPVEFLLGPSDIYIGEMKNQAKMEPSTRFELVTSSLLG